MENGIIVYVLIFTDANFAEKFWSLKLLFNRLKSAASLFVNRTTPEGLPCAKEGSTSYSFTATEQMNGAQIYCSHFYPSISDPYTVAVRST